MCQSPAKLITPEKMKHNRFSIYDDVIIHMKEFFDVFIENDLIETDDIEECEYMGNPEKVINFPLFMFAYPHNDTNKVENSL